MRVPLSWLAEYVALPPEATPREISERLIRAGLEVETVDSFGGDLVGPIVAGRVSAFVEEKQSNGKTIRWCQVEVGEAEPRGIVCGARNFAEGDFVVVVLPGAVLPGGFAIAARKTYGHVSDGMICSARELGMGDDHTGIIVLAPGFAAVGDDLVDALNLRDDVFDIAVTPDRGYCLSVRGVARETATAFGVAFNDPALSVAADDTAATDFVVRIDDPTGCDRIAMRLVVDVNPTAHSPMWIQRRLQMCGMRPVSLAVDITNYVMLELGQPLHAFDRSRLSGGIEIRRARTGESLETIDHSSRALTHEDLVVADAGGPLAVAGVMGGAGSEVGEATTDLVIEAAHFNDVVVARGSRRHKLSTEASRRFERGVDPELPLVATARASALLVELAGGRATGLAWDDHRSTEALSISYDLDRPTRTGGREVSHSVAVGHLRAVGCEVMGGEGGTPAQVTPPSWRPDLEASADLDEEVLRLEGYDSLPSRLPQVPAGTGLSADQRVRRIVSEVLAGAGCTEVLTYPFTSAAEFDAMRIPADDMRREAPQLLNPMNDELPLLRTNLLGGLLATAQRNIRRGASDVNVSEMGRVFIGVGPTSQAPRPATDRPITADEKAQLDARLPKQPRHLAVVIAGEVERSGWWGSGRRAEWGDAVEVALVLAAAISADLDVRQGSSMPWHPGRCAQLIVNDTTIGYAGELHPAVISGFELPARACAMELDLDALIDARTDVVIGPELSNFPVATQDVALVVDAGVAAGDVEAALRSGAGPLLESIRMFDMYTGEQVGEGKRSLAFALRFRAPDRTLTVEETTAARDAAVDEAARRVGAVQRV
jgi:phenylalanyl-tRNA synthetase beta chain